LPIYKKREEGKKGTERRPSLRKGHTCGLTRRGLNTSVDPEIKGGSLEKLFVRKLLHQRKLPKPPVTLMEELETHAMTEGNRRGCDKSVKEKSIIREIHRAQIVYRRTLFTASESRAMKERKVKLKGKEARSLVQIASEHQQDFILVLT